MADRAKSKSCEPNESTRRLPYFIEIEIAPQLRQLFSDPAKVESLRYRFIRQQKVADSLADIYDGAEYQRKCAPGEFLSNENNYSFSINTDGCAVTKSSKASA